MAYAGAEQLEAQLRGGIDEEAAGAIVALDDGAVASPFVARVW
jgi:hypothetical protein